jgi:hypothetical protein
VRRALRARRGAYATLSGVAVLTGLVLVLVAFLAAGCGSDPSAGAASGGSGKAAPDFQVTTFAGDNVSLASYQGKPLVLAFMASW